MSVSYEDEDDKLNRSFICLTIMRRSLKNLATSADIWKLFVNKVL